MEAYTNKRRKRIKLIFNPASGVNRQSPVQLMEVIKELQAWKFIPEPYLLEPDSDLAGLVRDSLAQGIHMFVVCGGDGTVSAVSRALLGTSATMGIIPTGTQNNVALSLGIPADIPAAMAVLRTGRRIKADIGLASCGKVTMPFLEICSIGLFSALFESGDDIQHGNISSIGNFLAKLTTSPPSEIRLQFDNKPEFQCTGHVVMVSNMPYFGRHYQVGPKNSFSDGFLDALFCSDISKLDLMIGYMLKTPGINSAADPRVKYSRIRRAVIHTDPPMPVMVDGVSLGEGSVSIGICRHALAVITPAENSMEGAGETIEK